MAHQGSSSDCVRIERLQDATRDTPRRRGVRTKGAPGPALRLRPAAAPRAASHFVSWLGTLRRASSQANGLGCRV
eukprot:418337-Heterocapsa_arctica.AAC.1